MTNPTIAWSTTVEALALLGLDANEGGIHKVIVHPMALEVIYTSTPQCDEYTEVVPFDMDR